jgi:hypothetical protein
VNWWRIDRSFYWFKSVAGRRSAKAASGKSRSLPELFAELLDAKSDVDGAGKKLEEKFLATSTELEALASARDQFVGQVESLVHMATGQGVDGSIFELAIRMVEQSTEFLVRCGHEMDAVLSSLRKHNAQIEELLTVDQELQRTMMPLKFVQTLFKAESAPLGPAVQEMFAGLTQEIEVLHSQVREIFGTKFRQLEETHRTISRVIDGLDRQTRLLRDLTKTHKKQIESSIESLKREMVSNHERDLRLGRLTKDFSHDVEQVVMALQFQDIVNQKLQHVSSALPEIEARFEQFQVAFERHEREESLHFVERSSRLEAGQLAAAEEELAKAESAIQGGIRRVLDRLKELDARCLSLDEFRLLTTSSDGMVQILLEMLGEVREMVSSTVSNAGEIYELLQPLGSSASDLTAIVREMSGRIHLIGLNAQVQAAMASDGRRGAGLEVLSARTSEISSETNRISEHAASRLDDLALGLSESVKAFSELRAEGVKQKHTLEVDGLAEEQQLHRFRDVALQAVQTIGTSLEEIRKRAEKATEIVEFKQFYTGNLPALRETLGKIAEIAEERMHEPEKARHQINLSKLLRRDYTMASERRIFEEIVEGKSSAPAGPDDGRYRTTHEAELFSESARQVKELTTVRATGSADAADETAQAAAKRSSDFGQNVELF